MFTRWTSIFINSRLTAQVYPPKYPVVTLIGTRYEDGGKTAVVENSGKSLSLSKDSRFN